MKCGDFDPRDLAVGELSGLALREAETHVAECAACAARLEETRLTVTALRLSPDREIPRRIAFVSDPVFELSWWQRFWRSGPQLGFASAAMLAAAILVHGWTVQGKAPAGSQSGAAFEKRVADEVARRLPVAVNTAVDQAVDAKVRSLLAGLEQRVDAMDKTRLASLERRVESREDLKNIESAFSMIERRLAVIQGAAARYGGDD
jgi:hypothetical protein